MEYRRHPRHASALPLRLITALGPVETVTTEVSLRGVSAPMVMPPELGERLPFVIELPDGKQLSGTAMCRNERLDGNVGFAIEFASADEGRVFADFLAQEESTGSLWRMLDRYREAGIDDGQIAAIVTHGKFGQLVAGGAQAQVQDGNSPRMDQDPISMRLHSSGENGVAYQIMFAKHPSHPPEHSEVFFRYPECQRIWHQISRVLEEKILIRLSESAPIISVQICELKRGGFAYLQKGQQKNCALASLSLGELVVTHVDGESLFPHFTEDELAQIACDTIRHDISQPMFRSLQASTEHPGVLAAQAKTESQQRRLHQLQGLGVLRQAVAEAQVVQTRLYGERAMRLFPELWARVSTPEGELMGPTLEDRSYLCLLALVGPGTPRVHRLDDDSDVRLMQRP